MHTVWKFQDLSGTQFLREINFNFSEFRISKTAIVDGLRGSKFGKFLNLRDFMESRPKIDFT